jgi:hypothetical protein
MYFIPASERTFHPFQISDDINDASYTVQGNVSEGVHPIELEIGTVGINILLETEQDGMIELNLARNVIDNIMSLEIGVSDYSMHHSFDEFATNDTHNNVRFRVPEGAHFAYIKGSYVVPEFGSLIMVVLALSLVALIGMMRVQSLKH